MTHLRRLLVAVVLVATLGCRPHDQQTDSADPSAARQEREQWPAGLAAQIDSGNAAIRTDSFDLARRHFLRATEIDGRVAAGWFGLYMAEQGRGDAESAMAALERARETAASTTMIHPNGDTIR